MQQAKQEKAQENPFKQKVFDYVAELVSNQINFNLYVILLLIDNLQFIAYYNNGLLTYNSLPFSTFSAVANYLNLLTFLQKYNINQFMVPFFFILNVVLVLLLVVGYRAHQRKMEKINKTVAERNYHKNKVQYFSNLLIMLYTTILTVPMFQCSLTAFYCSSNNPFTKIQTCYVGSHIIIAAMGFINLAWLLFLSFFVSIYYYNRNPFSQSYSTCSSNWYNLGRFIVKVAPMVYMMYDPNIAFPILFLITMNIIYPAYLFVFSKFLFGYYRYNFKLEQIVVAIEAFTAFLNTGFILVQLFQNTASKPNILLLFWCVAGLLIALGVAQMTGVLKRNLIKQIHQTEGKSLPSILQYLIYLIYQTQRNFEDSKQKGFFISNIARTHALKCQDPACYCHLYMQERNKPGYHRNKAVFYTLLLAIIDRIIKENKKAYPFFILKAYILNYKMESQIKAATTISIIMSDKLDFSDEMLVKGLLFELNEQYNDTRDMEIYRKFNEFLLQQEEESLTIVELYLSYWEQLIDQNSSIPKLQYILKSIKKQKVKMQTIVEGALDIFNNHVRVLFLYKSFLREVLNDYVASVRCEERYKIGLKQSKLSNVDTVNKIQFRPNQNLLVINFTRNYLVHSDILGSYKIVSISSNIRQFLGYSNTQLKNSSINKLIPRIYHKYHDHFIDSALEKKDADIYSNQFRIFPINSSGHIIECNLISKFMPNIAYGINIVSFLEQCDMEKDQYYLIYDAKTGIVDSMTKEAENILKDSSRRKNNDIFAAANDFIGDLLPHWDYKQEIWRQTLRNKKSIKSQVALSEGKIDVKHIQVVRSDGWKQKDIKILKFKGSFFSRMFSLSNQSDRLQRQMYVFNPRNMYSNLNTGELEQIIPAKTKQLSEREKERMKSAKQLVKTLQEQVLSIEEMPSKFSRISFIAVQCFIFLLAVGFTIFEFTNTNSTLNNYNEDTQLIFNINYLQSYESDMTYIISLTAVNLAYTNSNMSLPYASYVSQISAQSQLDQLDRALGKMFNILGIVNTVLISKIEKKEISSKQLMLNAKFLQIAGTKISFTKAMTVVQAIYQYISYGRQLVNDMRELQLGIQFVLPSPYYFFIFANSLDILPDNMINIKNSVLQSVNTSVSNSFTVFLVIKLLVSALILLSIITVLLYYRFIYQNYILKVLAKYEQISLDKIKSFEEKCSKYKYYIKQKNQKDSQEPKTQKSNPVLTINSGVFQDKKETSNNESRNEEEQAQPLNKQSGSFKLAEVEQYVSFQSKPQLKGIIFSKLVWIIIYGILLFVLCFSYFNATQSLNTGIITLNNYTLAQNSLIQIRLYTHLSLNMLNYWESEYLKIIDQELEKDFVELLLLINNTALDFRAFKPLLQAKVVYLKLIKFYRDTNDVAKINELTQTIEGTLQDMDSMLKYLLAQCVKELNGLQAETQTITTYLNIYISFSLVYILIYWLIGVRSFYKKLLEQHQLAYQMHNIIGFNLRKETQAIK